MSSSPTCALITVDRDGAPRVRTMDPFPPSDSLVVWFGTNPKSRKVAQIRHDQRVTLYYTSRTGDGYVSLSGLAEIVNDPQEKAHHWKEAWDAFYPDRDSSYTLIRVQPQRLEVVSYSRGIVGDRVTWTPPSAVFTGEKDHR